MFMEAYVFCKSKTVLVSLSFKILHGKAMLQLKLDDIHLVSLTRLKSQTEIKLVLANTTCGPTCGVWTVG